MIEQEIPRLSELSVIEKLLLIEELWDNLSSHPEHLPLWEWQKEELDKRYEEYKQNPTEGSQWQEVKERLLRFL